MRILNLYIGTLNKIYKKDYNEEKTIFKTYPERQTVFYITKDDQENLRAEDIKYGGVYQIDITDDNKVGDHIVPVTNLTPMFMVDMADPVFEDKKNLEIEKELVLKIFK